jgi:hypothetical protein
MGGRGMVSVTIREAQEEGLHPVGVRGGEYVRRGRGLALPLICGEAGGKESKQNIERRQRLRKRGSRKRANRVCRGKARHAHSAAAMAAARPELKADGWKNPEGGPAVEPMAESMG